MDKGKKRAPNFSKKEKEILLNIISEFKHNIIENKKTDSSTWRQKDEAWDNIATIFNSRSPESYPRIKDCLRKYYDNIKKNLRKQIANERIQINKTGGGIDNISNDPTQKLAESIINDKTLYGLQNPFDGDSHHVRIEIDTTSCSSTKDASFEESEHFNVNHVPVTKKEPTEDHSYVKNNKKRTHQNLSDSDEVTVCKSTNTNDWSKIAASQLRTPIAKDLQHKWTKRRRPKIQVPSSTFTEQYSELALIKKEVYTAEKRKVEQQIQYDEEIFNLTKEKLLLEIKLKNLQAGVLSTETKLQSNLS